MGVLRGEQGGRQELAQSVRRDSVGRGKMEVTWEGSVWGDSLEEASPQKMEEGKKKRWRRPLSVKGGGTVSKGRGRLRKRFWEC